MRSSPADCTELYGALDMYDNARLYLLCLPALCSRLLSPVPAWKRKVSPLDPRRSSAARGRRETDSPLVAADPEPPMIVIDANVKLRKEGKEETTSVRSISGACESESREESRKYRHDVRTVYRTN